MVLKKNFKKQTSSEIINWMHIDDNVEMYNAIQF